MHATGEPLTLKELNVYYGSVPDDQNAAAVYKQAFAILNKSSSRRFIEQLQELPSNTNGLPESLRQQMQKAVQENETALDVQRKAANLTTCRYPVDYTPGWNALLPHLPTLALCGKLEMCSGALEEQAGNIDAAIESVATISKYSASLDSEPDLISVVIKCELKIQAFELCRWILNHRRLSETQLVRLGKVFDDTERDDWVTRAAAGERCMVLPMFHYSSGDFLGIIQPNGYNRFDQLAMQLLRLSGEMKRDEIAYLDRLEQIRQATRLPYPEQLRRVEELRSEIRHQASSQALFATGCMLPGFLNGVSKHAQYLARMRLMQTAIAIEQFRNKNGHSPDAVQELVPEYLKNARVDPFSGEQLLYRKSAVGYLLYSIGPDRLDDNGSIALPLNLASTNVTGDIVLSVVR